MLSWIYESNDSGPSSESSLQNGEFAAARLVFQIVWDGLKELVGFSDIGCHKILGWSQAQLDHPLGPPLAIPGNRFEATAWHQKSRKYGAIQQRQCFSHF
ncbi:hypothetical protein EJB05_33492, partial [Eragrostis curvula]